MEFYRQVLFPAKAKIDLAYFSRRTLVSDLGWIVRAVWMIVAGNAWSRVYRGQLDQDRENEAERWHELCWQQRSL